MAKEPVTAVIEIDPTTRITIAPLKYRADIDGMRAVAVMLVLVFHFSLIAAAKAGFLGVDVFFVISGFLITTILKRQLDTRIFSVGAFYVNRIRRLAPALLAVLLMTMLAGALCLFPNELIELSKQALVSQLYVANFYYWRNVSYFGLGVHDVFLLHTWSLAVEEQFYLIYPVCILFLHRHLKKYFWPAIVLGFLISFGLNILFVGQKPEATFYLLPTRAWELLAGAIVPLVAGKWARSKSTDEILGLLGAGLVIIGVTCYRDDFHFPGFYALLPTTGTACLLLSGQGRATNVSQILSWPPIVYIGKISYSLYLVHWPINVFAGLLIENYSTVWRLAMFALSIVLAAIVYHAVEEPTHHKRYLATKDNLLLGYAVGIAATASVFAIVQLSDGLPHRFPDQVARLANYANDKEEHFERCDFTGQSLMTKNSFCQIGAAGQSPEWLVYGDSHAWAAYPAFDKWLKLNGQGGLFIFRHGCPPLNGVHLFGDKGECFEFNQAVTRFIENHAYLSHIVLVSTWRQAIEGALSMSSQVRPTKEESVQLFTDRFSQTLRHLHDLGRQVYVWEPVPGARKNVPRELARAAWEHRTADIEISLDEYLSTYSFFFDALKKNRQWISASFSPSEALCNTGKCAVSYEGNPLYADSGHITKSTVNFWVQVLQRGKPPQ
jgi:peptidoglycan/LPS O-acetylase OafA/YrhL